MINCNLKENWGNLSCKKHLINLEDNTGLGIEFLQLKKQDNHVWYRTNWGKPPERKRWNKSKFTTPEDFIKATEFNHKYRTKEEWEQIRQERIKQTKQISPLLDKQVSIQSKIREIESRMIGGKVPSISKVEQEQYYKLTNELKEVLTEIHKFVPIR